MAGDAMLELILFVRSEHGWRLELDREGIMMGGDEDKFVVTVAAEASSWRSFTSRIGLIFWNTIIFGCLTHRM